MYLSDSKLTPRHFYKGLLELERHMTYAGAERDVFTDGAIDEIFRFSSGTARLVNKVCTHCLIYGAQNRHRIIDDHMVKRVIQGEIS